MKITVYCEIVFDERSAQQTFDVEIGPEDYDNATIARGITRALLADYFKHALGTKCDDCNDKGKSAKSAENEND